MKKILIFLILSLLATNNLSAFEFEKRMQLFNRWLNVNGYEQYLDKTSGPIDMILDRSLCSPKEIKALLKANFA